MDCKKNRRPHAATLFDTLDLDVGGKIKTLRIALFRTYWLKLAVLRSK